MEKNDSLLPYVKLHFNLNHPNLEECYIDGYETAKAELDEEDNPYAVGTLEHEQWQEGWWAGFYEEEPALQLNDSFEEESAPKQEIGGNKAANDQSYHPLYDGFIARLFQITGALAATAVVGYQVIDLVA